ncbi:class I lanthipeptide [Mucilaginibacter sp. cycad4]|uniref:class I lanthipeptide n=1 Tax=Mucilaginibacter sp. cycad4 TaxID=3342096 RepID=UPI002AAB8E92|nr:class I lanthipeptide [Mucilaginibacter gossypii]WPV01568.1 class I lanthipeptide [Mucilaginibacter gossypii]
MKKIKLDPLALDKQTIAKLDERQLQEILGGAVADFQATSGDCNLGSSSCGTTGNSGSCNTGSSQC